MISRSLPTDRYQAEGRTRIQDSQPAFRAGPCNALQLGERENLKELWVG